MKKNVNKIELSAPIEGVERQAQILFDILYEDGVIVPETISYKDIDDAFKTWVEEELRITSDTGSEFPTMLLFTNQRFSEYTQSWKFTDKNNNILLNFKTVTRDQNPIYGKVQNGLYNIPGEHYWLIKRVSRLDDNGTESFLDIKVKQPTAVDLSYTVSIFTTKYDSINEFNEKIVRMFNSCQAYIRPKMHYMPMTLGNINDISEKSIEDRRFYGQEYQIRVMGYIISEDDYKIEEVPLKRKITFGNFASRKKIPEVEVEECGEPYNPYYYKSVNINVSFPLCSDVSEFTFDSDFKSDKIELKNILNNYKVFINGEEQEKDAPLVLKYGDVVRIMIKRRNINRDAMISFIGYDPTTVYNEEKDNMESELDETNVSEEYDIC